MNLLTQLTDTELLVMALEETAKLVPYVTSSRKAVKVYLKVPQSVYAPNSLN